MKRFADSRWTAVGAAALVAVLMTVVAAVATGLPGTESASSVGVDFDVLADLFSPVMRLLYGLALLAATYRWLLGSRVVKRGRRRAPISPWAVLAAMAVVAAVFLLVLPNLHFGGAGETEQTTPFTTTTTVAERAAPGSGSVLAAGPDVWILVAVAVAVFAFVVLRRRTASAPGSLPLAYDPSHAPPVWIESDPSPSDTRSRVLAAYRRVAGRAAEAGLARAGPETVTSHLRRLARPGQEATGRLADLYNRARFSSHPTSASEAASAEELSDQIRESMGRDENH